MVYGLINDRSNQTEVMIMRSKKIKDSSIATVSQIINLVNRLDSGDTVWLTTVLDFPSVSRFIWFAETVLQRGAVLRMIEQPYLEVGNGKHWKESVREHLRTLVMLEQSVADRFHKAFEFTNQERVYADRCIADITVGVLAKTYASDGILHRGC